MSDTILTRTTPAYFGLNGLSGFRERFKIIFVTISLIYIFLTNISAEPITVTYVILLIKMELLTVHIAAHYNYVKI